MLGTYKRFLVSSVSMIPLIAVRPVGKALKKNNSLQELDLSFNALTPAAVAGRNA